MGGRCGSGSTALRARHPAAGKNVANRPGNQWLLARKTAGFGCDHCQWPPSPAPRRIGRPGGPPRGGRPLPAPRRNGPWGRRQSLPGASEFPSPTPCFHPAVRIDTPPEWWPSGRRHTPAKGAGGKPSRGFESLPLRHIQILNPSMAPTGAFLLFVSKGVGRAIRPSETGRLTQNGSPNGPCLSSSAPRWRRDGVKHLRISNGLPRSWVRPVRELIR